LGSITKRGDKYRAQIKKDGRRETATFTTKTAAVAWCLARETVPVEDWAGNSPDKTFGDALERYRDEVAITKKGERWEVIRINRLLGDPICQVRLVDLKAPHFSKWRDARLKQVSPATVRREWNQLSSICNYARKEWHWMDHNPMSDLKRPPEPVARDRIITQDEIERLCAALAYNPDFKPVLLRARVGAAMLLALETGMRAGELCALRWEDVRLDERWLKVTDGKTRAAMRKTPLTTEAVRILTQMEPGEGSVFDMTPRQLDSNFRQGKTRAGIPVEDNLHFHDTRHNAITRLSKHLSVLELARAIGHADVKQLMTYYNPDVKDLAAALP